MTDKQLEVLLALDLRQTQMAEAWADDPAVWTEEIAAVAGISNRSAAAVLRGARERGWVRSVRGTNWFGWRLTSGGVQALEENWERINACLST